MNTLMFDFFSGISRVEFDEIIPLKLYFQEDHLSNIRASPTTITEDFCGKFLKNVGNPSIKFVMYHMLPVT